MKKTILTCILVCLGCTHLQATTIVVVRTPTHFVVAADSLWSSDDKPMFLCKMRRFGHIFFVASTTDIDGAQLMNFAMEAMKASKTVAEAARRLGQRSDEIAKRTVGNELQSSIDKCWGGSCAEAMFFGIENGVPTLVVVNFVQGGNSRKALKFVPNYEITCPGMCPAAPFLLFALGQHDEIDNIKRKDPKFVERYSDQEVARILVEIEEKAAPEIVGGPIDVLTLDTEGPHWSLVKGGTCSHEETNPTNEQKPKPKAK
jgi:hypothetical protein